MCMGEVKDLCIYPHPPESDTIGSYLGRDARL